MKYTIDELKEWLKNNLSEERYEHSLGVADCAKELAKKYNIDTDKAYLAVLIHDCAKCMKQDKMKIAVANYIQLEEEELNNKKTFHAPAGAYIANKELGIEDSEILNAIRWHTIGHINMTMFEKIIFLADKIETRTREDEIAQPIRDELKNSGIDAALFLCYKNTIISLCQRNLAICKQTIDIYNSMLNIHVKNVSLSE